VDVVIYRRTPFNHEDIELRYLNKNLVLIDSYVNMKTKVKTKCHCGQLFYSIPSSVLYSSIDSCGCLWKSPKDITNKKFGNLTAIDIQDNYGSGIYWNCICDCGNKITISRSYLTSVRSCGCLKGKWCRKNLSGVKFGNLTAIEIDEEYSKNRVQVYWKCKCKCGGTKICHTGLLLTNKTRSCGNCDMKINGRLVSYMQLDIHRMINSGVLNFKSGPYYIDIALVKNGKKIAVEYDSWYWHGDTLEQDEKRVKYLIDHGWSVFSIKSDYEVPCVNDIQDHIEILSKDNCYYSELKLSDWGKRKNRKNKRKLAYAK